MVKIIQAGASVYHDFGTLMPALTMIFNGSDKTGPGALIAALGVGGCAGAGRDPHDCATNADKPHFQDTGFHSDFRDGYNQPYHAWGYIAETSSPGRPVAGIIGQLTAVGGNVFHEYIQSLLGIDNGYGTSWQDYVLAERAADIGVLITDQVITPIELAEIVQTYFGVH